MRGRRGALLATTTAALLAVALVVTLATAWAAESVSSSHARPASATVPLATFDPPGDGIRFRYPATWHAVSVTDGAFAPSSTLIALLTNTRLDTDCTTKRHNTSCRSIDRLAPESVLISLTDNGFPGWSLAHEPGRILRIHGRLAKLAVTRARCDVTGDVTMDLVIPTFPDNWDEFDACIAGPGARQLEDQFKTIIKTIRITD